MPLPQQVVEQLGHDSVQTPGWSPGILFFSGGVLGIVVAIYIGLTYGYQPYLNNFLTQTRNQINTESQSVTPAQQAELFTYYSQIANLNRVVAGHILFSQFLTWLESNTQANVYYGSLTFASGNQVTLTTFAKTEADANQQIAIFQTSPEVSAVSVASIAFSPSAGMWTFSAILTLHPSLLLWQSTSSTVISTETNAPSTTPLSMPSGTLTKPQTPISMPTSS